MCRVANHKTRLSRATSSLALNVFRDGASTASLGNLFQCVTTLCVKNFLLISNLSSQGMVMVRGSEITCIYFLTQTLDVVWVKWWAAAWLAFHDKQANMHSSVSINVLKDISPISPLHLLTLCIYHVPFFFGRSNVLRRLPWVFLSR